MDEKKPAQTKTTMTSDTGAAETPTIAQRVQASAAGLARDAVFGTRHSNASSVLAEALASGGKAESSTASTDRIIGSTRQATPPPSNVTPSDPGSQSRLNESFRSKPASLEGMGFDPRYETGEAGLFTYPSIATEDPPEAESSREAVISTNGKTSEALDFEAIWKSSGPHDKPSPGLSQSYDGAVVVDLLSKPSFQPAYAYENADLEADHGTPYTISAEEMDFARKLETLLPPAAITGKQQAGKSSVSGILPASEHVGAAKPVQLPYTGAHQSAGLGLSDDGRGQSVAIVQMETFLDEISTYHEEVWGFLLPHVQAARSEILDHRAHGGSNIADGPAVRRLGMLLMHLEASEPTPTTDSLHAMLQDHQARGSTSGHE